MAVYTLYTLLFHSVIESINAMRIQTTIQKWGNGLALRVSGAMREIPGFQEGSVVEVEITENGLLVEKPKAPTGFPISEQTLLDSLDESTAHADLVADPIPGEIPE